MKNIKGFDSKYYKETVEVSDVVGGTFTEAEQIYLFSSCNCSFTLIVNGSNLGLFQRCDLSFIDYTDSLNYIKSSNSIFELNSDILCEKCFKKYSSYYKK